MPTLLRAVFLFLNVVSCRSFRQPLSKWVRLCANRSPQTRDPYNVAARAKKPLDEDDEINSIETYKEGLLPLTAADRAKFEAARDNAALVARAQAIQSAGGGRAGALVQLVTQEPVGDTLLSFFMSASPMVSSAMREAVAGLLGGMPRDVGIVYKTSSDKLGSLAGMLMMTGYLFRNAEYVVTLQQLLNIKSRSLDEYKRVFDEIDQDGSGFIEAEEVQTLLASFYGGDKPPQFEVDAFVRFFDRRQRGKISWKDFQDGFGLAAKVGRGGGGAGLSPERLLELAAGGAAGAATAATSGRLLGSGSDRNAAAANGTTTSTEVAAVNGTAAEASDAAAAPPAVKLSVEGKISVELEGGAKVEIDAAEYLDGLKAEADALRSALQQAALAELQDLGLAAHDKADSGPAGKAAGKAAASGNGDAGPGSAVAPRKWTGLADYLASLGPAQKAMLTESIEPATVEAMRRLVAFMVGETNPSKDAEFELERGSLASLCLWQLVVGYQLRDAEATGKAAEIRGR